MWNLLEMEMKKQTLDYDGSVLVVKYGNGTEFRGDTSVLPQIAFVDCAAARHGLKQKLGDAKSGGTMAEKLAEVKLIWSNLLTGDWNRKGEASGTENLMPEVFVVLAGGDEEKAMNWLEKWEGLSAEGKEVVSAKPDVKAALQKVKADRKLAGMDMDEADPFEM